MAVPGVDPLRLAELADPARPRPRAARATASAPSAPQRSRMFGSESHITLQKPPLRPLGPWPQVLASSRTTRASGSSAFACQAAHIPV